MALVKSRAISLKNYRLGETSKVVVCYTRDYGKVRLVAKGARKGGGRLGAALEPTQVSGVVFYLRQERDLLFVSQAEVERQWPELQTRRRADGVRRCRAGADGRAGVGARAGRGSLRRYRGRRWNSWPQHPRRRWTSRCGTSSCRWQVRSGTRRDSRAASSAAVRRKASLYFAARRGGIVCGIARARSPGRNHISAASAAILAALPGDARRGHADRRARRDRRDTEGFSGGARGTRQLKLKSLEFLAQIRRTGHFPVEPEREHEG